MSRVVEQIVVRGRVVEAELIYISVRGDYKTYMYRGKVYRVDTQPERGRALGGLTWE